MSRPVQKHGYYGQVPSWDPKAVAVDYLIEMKEAAQKGALDPRWLDEINRWLAHELRAVYSPGDAKRASDYLDPLMARIIQFGHDVERMKQKEMAPPHVSEAAARQPVPEPPQQAPVVLPPDNLNQSKSELTEALAAASASIPSKPQSPSPETNTLLAHIQQARSERTNPQYQAQSQAVRESLALSGAAIALDGRKLRKSAIPTWLALVGLSWVALLWGSLISAPFGVGVAIIGTGFLGAIAVPLFASVVSHVSMDFAHKGTLAKLDFKEVKTGHRLDVAADVFAKALAIPKPEVGTFDACNAFAMGSTPSNAVVAIGTPLLDYLSEEEVLAVLGHEMGHVVSGDMRKMMLMRTFQNATVWYMFAQSAKQFARWCISWAAELYILAFSRKREFWADAIGAALTSKEAMIGALRKLEQAPELTPAEHANARFMFRGRAASLLSTHPTFEDRIAALEQETFIRQLPRA